MAQPKVYPGTHPVWRCRRCSYWVPRLTDEAPPCPNCKVKHKRKVEHIYMHESVRKPPDPKGFQ